MFLQFIFKAYKMTTTNLEQQVKDWRTLRELSLKLRDVKEVDRKPLLDQLYSGVKKYYDTYHSKFDFCKEPK